MDKHQLKSKEISKELKALSNDLEKNGIKNFHNEARKMINEKYGKGWREDLDLKSITENPKDHTERFKNMNYY